MSTTDYSDMVGVFRDRANAEQAVSELKQVGFAEDDIQLTEYELQGAVEALSASPSLQSPNKRIIVHVKAPGKEQEAVGIMAQHGANNADIPAGMTLVHGTLVATNAETADLVPGQSNAEVSSKTFFGDAKTSGQLDEFNTMDKPDLPRT